MAWTAGSGRLPDHPVLLVPRGSPAVERGRRESMSLSALRDESLLRFYESVRKEVEADRDSMRRGHTHFFANSDGVKKYAAGLRQELERRRLSFPPILWL